MKNIFIFMIACTVISSCKKEESITDKIAGTWEWVESVGHLSGDKLTPDNTGNTLTIIVSKNSYLEIVNMKSGIDRNIKTNSSRSRKGDNVDMMFFDNGEKKSIRFSGDTLKLYDECYDCYEHSYKKRF